ncbi:MAG: hypothetical protein JXQ90_18175 [Cyclobacteriaceae bacterium]
MKVVTEQEEPKGKRLSIEKLREKEPYKGLTDQQLQHIVDQYHQLAEIFVKQAIYEESRSVQKLPSSKRK